MNHVVSHIPIYFVRFEDLQKNPATILKNVFSIVLGVTSIEGTILERRIDEISAKI